MPEITVSENGAYKLLASLNPRKAAGPDGVPCRLLQAVAKEHAPALTLLFNSSLATSQVPQQWKHALVQPILKRGDSSQAANYRSISLTCICCKLLKHIVRSEITGHPHRNDIIADAQHGFRKRRSCETQLILTVENRAGKIGKGGQTNVVLLGFSKESCK